MNISEYVRPKDLKTAYDLLNEDKKNLIIGGGAWLKLSVKSANKLISLDHLNLNKIEVVDDFIEIGAYSTLREIETNEFITSLFNGILSKSLSNIMGINIRNIATIGGSVIGKYSFSDILPVLEVFETKLVFYKSGEIDLSEYLENSKFPKDILLKLKIRKQKGFGFFKKVATTPLDFSIINVACTNSNNELKISVGSTPSLAKLCIEAMNYINGVKVKSEKEINKCVEIALSELKFSSNIRSSKEYREHLAKVYITRGIKQVINYED